MDRILEKVQTALAKDFTATALKLMIIAWAVLVVIVTLKTENKWFLAGILAYEILP